MIKRLSLILIALVILILTLACNINVGGLGRRTVRGSSRVIDETREVEGIDAVELATIGTLFVEVGDEEALRVEAEDNLLPYIDTEVRSGMLVIDTDPQTNLRNTRSIDYYLTVQELSAIRLSSSGDVEAPDLDAGRFEIRVSSSGNLTMGALSCDTCDIRLSSSGDVDLDAVYGERLNVRISSSGNLTIDSGDVERQDVRLSSSGNYNAGLLDSEAASVQISSSGSATVRVDGPLKADLSSSGNLRYYGDPDVEASTSSSGDVIDAGE
jgi:hypothetical protein